MKKFLDKDFLLETETAKVLYHEYAKKMPIYDFHCHLSPKEIYEDKKYRSLEEVWIGGGADHFGDHYKWRLMREYGIEEHYITGTASDYEKFEKWAEMLPYAIGNPIYHWSHLELQRYFGIDTILNPNTAKEIYDEAGKKLETLTARKMIEMNNVAVIYTTDDPIDDLRYHELIAQDKSFKTKVCPSFRPDKALNVELDTFMPWLSSLEKAVGFEIKSLDNLLDALSNRVKFFDERGCAISDHALDVVYYEDASKEEVEIIFNKVLNNEKLSEEELNKYKGYVLVHLGKEYHKYDWVQQYHIGALRNNSKRMYREIGPDTGFDATQDQPFAAKLAKLLGKLDDTDELPRTILYCLNPRDNEVLATIKNCFQQGGVVAKIQFGSGWWFNDQKDGMERQLTAYSCQGLLSKFVGMLTDSRSFLSYTRHEYFRRILCNMFGNLIESGQYPNDVDFVGRIVEDICFNNAARAFKTLKD